MAKNKLFPIRNIGVTCQHKWSESDIFLPAGKTHGCHKGSSPSNLTLENFKDFHNTETKVRHRQQMLAGQWPDDGSCWSCRDLELAGGHSQRQHAATIPDMYPKELDTDPTAVVVSPTEIEILFDNACNLSCIYCCPSLSSKIESEERKFGGPIIVDSRVDYFKAPGSFKQLLPLFINWLDENYENLLRISILGGETFIQPEFWKFFEFIKTKKNKQLELSLISNLIIKQNVLIDFCDQSYQLIANNQVKKIKILASADCWGPEQEYIRYGFDTTTFKTNIEYLLGRKFISLGLHSCITALSINSMPLLAKQYKEWSKLCNIEWALDISSPVDHVLSPVYQDYSLFEKPLRETLDILETINSEGAKSAHRRITGVIKQIKNTPNDIDIQKKMLYYLDNIDLRRGLNWRSTFPWLDSYFKRKNISNENILEEQK